MAGQRGSGPAMPERRRDIAEWRRERILDAALAVFGRKGVDGASMKEVAASAGVAPGLLYHYFTGKEALSLAVTVERGFLRELRELLEGARQRPAAVVLPEVAIGFDQMMGREHGAHVGLFIAAMSKPMLKGALAESMRETHLLLGRYLIDRVAAGELRPHDPRAVVQALFSACSFGHIIGDRVDPIAVAKVILQGIEAL
jgi:AcrR family transcriptional regulator